MAELHEKKCIPCEGGMPPLTKEQAGLLLEKLKSWRLSSSKEQSIEKDYKMKDFREALAFVNEVGDIAEFEGHHPDILIHSWNKVRISLSTHAIKGLSENDFILAAKIDQIEN